MKRRLNDHKRPDNGTDLSRILGMPTTKPIPFLRTERRVIEGEQHTGDCYLVTRQYTHVI